MKRTLRKSKFSSKSSDFSASSSSYECILDVNNTASLIPLFLERCWANREHLNLNIQKKYLFLNSLQFDRNLEAETGFLRDAEMQSDDSPFQCIKRNINL